MTRERLRQITLWLMAVDFPMLYLGAVSFENSAVTLAALGVVSLSAAVASLVY